MTKYGLIPMNHPVPDNFWEVMAFMGAAVVVACIVGYWTYYR